MTRKDQQLYTYVGGERVCELALTESGCERVCMVHQESWECTEWQGKDQLVTECGVDCTHVGDESMYGSEANLKRVYRELCFDLCEFCEQQIVG